MAYFKPRQEKRNLPKAPEGSSIGGASLYDAFVESIWRRTLDEYDRRGIGFNLAGETTISYPDKEVWWDDPRSRLSLLREFNKYYSEEDLEKERILKEETDVMEKSFFELLLNRSTPKRQWFWDAKRKARGDDKRRIGGGGVV
jgi:hypothetical protein